LHLSAIWSICARKDWLTKAGREWKISRIKINGNDLKGNTFRFLCTKSTEGTCKTASSTRTAVNRHLDGAKDKYAGQTYEMQATFPEPLSPGVLGAKTYNLRYLKDQSM
jgi:hypothetical protein